MAFLLFIIETNTITVRSVSAKSDYSRIIIIKDTLLSERTCTDKEESIKCNC